MSTQVPILLSKYQNPLQILTNTSIWYLVSALILGMKCAISVVFYHKQYTVLTTSATLIRCEVQYIGP